METHNMPVSYEVVQVYAREIYNSRAETPASEQMFSKKWLA